MPFERLKGFVAEYRPKIEEVLRSFLEKKRWKNKFVNTLVNDIERFAFSGGKRLRPILVLLGCKGAGREINEDVLKVAASYEILHDYLLIHDDIMDRDELRRNQPTVWKSLADWWKKNLMGDPVWGGISLGIVAGDMAQVYYAQLIFDTNLDSETKVRILKALKEIEERTAWGQILDIALEGIPLPDVSEEDVLLVHELKTAKYSLEGPLHIGAIVAQNLEVMRTYSDFAIPVGIAFQLKDDILGVFGKEEKVGKPVGSDIREGKRTILVLKAYESAKEEEREFLLSVLGKKDLTERELEEVRRIIIETGALEYVEKKAEKLVEQGKAALKRSEIDPEAKEILLELADYVVRREK